MNFLKGIAIAAGFIGVIWLFISFMVWLFKLLLPVAVVGFILYYIFNKTKESNLEPKTKESFRKAPGFDFDVSEVKHVLNVILEHQKETVTREENLFLSEQHQNYEELVNKTGEGFVLFVQEKGTGNVKMTKAVDPYQRLINGVMRESEYKLEVVHLIKTDFEGRTERLFMEFFKDKELENGWYDLSSQDIEWIKNGDYPLDILESLGEKEMTRIRKRK